MSAFTADLAELEAVVDRLASFGSLLLERVADLDAEVARLRGEWLGDAADEHAAAHAQWSRGAREMADGLDGMRRCVATAHENYRSAVSANLAMWP